MASTRKLAIFSVERFSLSPNICKKFEKRALNAPRVLAYSRHPVDAPQPAPVADILLFLLSFWAVLRLGRFRKVCFARNLSAAPASRPLLSIAILRRFRFTQVNIFFSRLSGRAFMTFMARVAVASRLAAYRPAPTIARVVTANTIFYCPQRLLFSGPNANRPLDTASARDARLEMPINPTKTLKIGASSGI